MKKDKTTILMILFFFMGLSILLYPTVSNFYNSRVQSKAIVDYEAILNDYDEDKYKEVFLSAESYNYQLHKLEEPLKTYNVLKNYNDVLNINGTGMIGYISIDRIDVNLPIYHGTSNKVLSKGVGHIEGTSLPIGGLGTHSVLSAHRGLPSSKLFTDLDEVEVGDIFTITVLNKELTYEIDKIVIVDPDEVDNLKIDEDKDYVTLVTCTPYGINTHRLLVRGRRIEDTGKKLYVTTEAYKISNLVVAPIVAIPIILILLLIIIFKPIKSNKKNIDEYLYPIKNKEKGDLLGGKNNDNEKN